MAVVFTSLTLRGDKNLKPDKDGYYPMILGRFNAFNKSGIFYKFTDQTRKMIQSSPVLRKRIQDGKLKGEWGHPAHEEGMSINAFLSRLGIIKESNIAIQIREFTLQDPDKDGSILVTGWIRPAGPHMEAVKKDFEDPYTNVAVSLRSIVGQKVVNGVLVREIQDLITWDYVGSNGVEGADKHGAISAGLESEDLLVIEDEDIPSYISKLEDKIEVVGLESDEGKDLSHTQDVLKRCRTGECYLSEWK